VFAKWAQLAARGAAKASVVAPNEPAEEWVVV